MRGRELSSVQQPAAPPRTDFSIVFESRPALCRRAAPRRRRSSCRRSGSGCTIFVCWPAPAPPWCTIVLPMASNSGRTRSSASASPPTMIDSVRVRAPDVAAGDRRVERVRRRLASGRLAISIASDGSLVVMSTSIVPGARAGEDAVAPRIDLAHVGREADDREDDVGLLGGTHAASRPRRRRHRAAAGPWPRVLRVTRSRQPLARAGGRTSRRP